MLMLTYIIPLIVKDEEGNELPELSHDESLIEQAVDDFNNTIEPEYLSDGGGFPIRNIISVTAGNPGTRMLVAVKYNGNYNDLIKSSKFVEIIRQALAGQCSDGWGEGFEQFPREINYWNSKSKKFIEYENLYVSTWEHNGREPQLSDILIMSE